MEALVRQLSEAGEERSRLEGQIVALRGSKEEEREARVELEGEHV